MRAQRTLLVASMFSAGRLCLIKNAFPITSRSCWISFWSAALLLRCYLLSPQQSSIFLLKSLTFVLLNRSKAIRPATAPVLGGIRSRSLSAGAQDCGEDSQPGLWNSTKFQICIFNFFHHTWQPRSPVGCCLTGCRGLNNSKEKWMCSFFFDRHRAATMTAKCRTCWCVPA